MLEPDYVYILEGYGISQIGTDNMDCQRKQFKFKDRMEILSFFALRIRTQKRIEILFSANMQKLLLRYLLKTRLTKLLTVY
jgi:hypothetical protein